MFKKSSLLLFKLTATLIVLSSPQCKKNTDELSKLPPITQEGKRTFGCLVNGKAWIPENENLILTDPPLKFVYENVNGGLFYISAEKTISPGNIDQSINIGMDSCIDPKTYYFNSTISPLRFAFNNYSVLPSSCTRLFSADSEVVATGQVIISRFSLNEGIISGMFEFSLSKPGCESIRITNGRFDAKM